MQRHLDLLPVSPDSVPVHSHCYTDLSCLPASQIVCCPEFDPYFNYRVTRFLTKEGFYSMWNWFDDRTWYPLGRVVGGTLYPVRAMPSARALTQTVK